MSTKRVLFATDFSTANDELLAHAVALAHGMNALLLIVHVEDTTDDRQREMKRRLKAVISEVPGLACEHHLLHGKPADEIIAFATNHAADLIVMGTHGRTGLRRSIMGSVAEAVARRASCPVMIYRSQAPFDTEPFADVAAGSTGITEFETSRALQLLRRAIDARASDVHLDTTREGVDVRLRIDGRMEHYCHFDKDMGRSLVNQLKVLAELEGADPFRPKEARIPLAAPLEQFDVRLTLSPIKSGEAIALRLLDRDRLIRPLESLGFSAVAKATVDELLKSREGLVLVTGPTGSGKTTTLYSMLSALDDGSRNIVSIEDPVEFDIPSFRQIGVDARHGVTMTEGLRTILRMDPDIVLVGEIRDRETAEIAMRAASSGKRVFSSLHTRDVASTITALRDLHVPDRSIADNIAGVLSQRLIRRLCQECCRQIPTTAEVCELFHEAGIQAPSAVSKPVGCARCRMTGYYDRIGVFQVARFSEELAMAISSGAGELQLNEVLASAGTVTLCAEALTKLSQQITSLEEVQKMRWE